ncbi:hypothetical protein C2857_004715 [Epichloe festucae Fl1]|uniref:Uncharacterized protein n=1 Tax=Epichloe festucae (strain Fl1) TaxID=877507 RepID=A0A7S9KVC5_EPIFF|nr:hypothetical protein C2857_004715 [Epichloe festucae Fl1]
MLICRLNFAADEKVDDVIKKAHDQVLEDLVFQHCSLADIQHALNIPSRQALFNTIVSFHRNEEMGADEDAVNPTVEITELDSEHPTEYDLALNIGYGTEEVVLSLTCRSLSRSEKESVTSLLRSNVIALTTQDMSAESKTPKRLSDLDKCSSPDLYKLWEWNKTAFETVDGLVHDIFPWLQHEIGQMP